MTTFFSSTLIGNIIRSVVVDDTGSPADPAVATLANGNVVVLWRDDGDDVNYWIYNSDLTATVRGKTAVDTSLSNEPQVIALPNGEFVIIYDDDDSTPSIRGRKFDSNGTPDGGFFTIDAGVSGSPEVGVTIDGRLLFTWLLGGNVYMSIWDPRDGNITTSTYDFPSQNFLDGDIIYGKTIGGVIFGELRCP